MIKIEQKFPAAGSGQGTQNGLHLATAAATPRSNITSISSARPHLALVPVTARKRRLGKKGREALARRRALDGAFLTVAMGTVALLWWSTF